MTGQRPPYPTNYYTRLRKESNFGCAACGVPFPVAIHHIEGYEENIVAPLEELILLCKRDHELADDDKIAKEILYGLKKKPFNVDRASHNFSIPQSKQMVAHIGNNTFIETPFPIVINKEVIVGIKREKGQILVSTKFYDKNDKLHLELIDNVWSATTDAFDVRYSERTKQADVWVAIKMNDQEPYLDIKIIGGELHIEGNFYRNGNLYTINKDGVFHIRRNLLTMTGCTLDRCTYGIVIDGEQTIIGAARI